MTLTKLILGTVGIYTSYLTMSILSESLYSTPYQTINNNSLQDTTFHFPNLLVWFSSLLCSLFGIFKGKFDKQPPNPIPLRQKMLLGLFFCGTFLCTASSLLYLCYLDQALGRNCKYLTAVIIGTLFSKVHKDSHLRLPRKKIIIALVITSGVIMFTYCGAGKIKKTNQHQFNPSQQWKGYILLIASLIFDALFIDLQAHQKSIYKPTANHLMTSANLFTFLFVFGYSVLSGQVVEQFYFCIAHPEILCTLIFMSGLQIFGQISIYYVIANFKQHIFPLIATTRKVLTVLLSIAIYNHDINSYQWIAILIVFIGISFQVIQELKVRHRHHKKNSKQIENNHSRIETNKKDSAIQSSDGQKNGNMSGQEIGIEIEDKNK